MLLNLLKERFSGDWRIRLAGLPRVRIDPALAGKVRLAVVAVEGLAVDTGEAILARFEPFCRDLAEKFKGLLIGDIPGVSLARELYRAVGVDPTRVRPSSEALLRRAVKGQGFYRINSLVDTINYCSLSCLLPIGLYDLDLVQGDSILLRLGLTGESFGGIRKDSVHLEGRYTLADALGPFGSPTSDSERTSIGESTVRCLALIFAPFSMNEETLVRHGRFTVEQIALYGGGGPQSRLAGLIG
jgi:DNA/RNA-binding domain of Phe-tRNA-synthetase-like protein